MVAWQRECLDLLFQKKVVVGKRPIPYGLCVYEHVFEGMSGNTLLFYTGTSLYWALFRDKIHFACSKILKFITILISTSMVTCYCHCFCFNKCLYTYSVQIPGPLFEIFCITLVKVSFFHLNFLKFRGHVR